MTRVARTAHSIRHHGFVALLALQAVTPPNAAAQQRAVARAVRPDIALVVLVAVDQFRPDYFARFGSQLDGGLARIRRSAVFYPHAMQDHAFDETAPGHSTMLSGREPARTGIVTNAAGVADDGAPLLGVQGDGASPLRFRGTTLYDWMRARDPGARVLSVSRKDRAAILPVGRARGTVLWYAQGRFTTSRYYGSALPAWVEHWNRGFDVARYAGTSWSLLLPDSAYHEPDDEPYEGRGKGTTFPHVLPGTRADLIDALEEIPAMDSLTLDLALRGVAAMGLGARGHPDLLSVSLSATDAVGHAYGPDSREIHDDVLRVDRYLGWFLDSLDALVPRARTLVVLTADHGVSPFPEHEVRMGRQGGRVDLGPLAHHADSTLSARFGIPLGIEIDNGLVTGDVDALRARGLDVDSLAAALATQARAHPGVLATYTHRTLAAAPLADSAARRIRRALPRDFGWLLVAVARPGFVFSDGVKGEHGTMNAADVTVPIAMVVPGVAPRTVNRRARTVDIAPTLAALLGIEPTERIDGEMLPEIVRP